MLTPCEDLPGANKDDDQDGLEQGLTQARLPLRQWSRSATGPAYARAKQRMATENWGARQGGGQAVIEDDSAFAPSDGDPVYNASYRYRGEA